MYFYICCFHNKLKGCKGAIVFFEQHIHAFKSKQTMFTCRSDSVEPFISSTLHLCIFDLKSSNGCSLLHEFKFTVINLQEEDKYLCRYR